jgi:PAS domain S-box-containing protein
MTDPATDGRDDRPAEAEPAMVAAAEDRATADRAARLAARLLATPVARITLLDDKGEWLSATFEPSARDTDEAPLRDRIVATRDMLLVADAAADKRFAGMKPVREGRLHFFLGVPLIGADGAVIGTLSVSDRVPRPNITRDDATALVDLARLVVDDLRLRRALRRARDELASRDLAEERLTLLNALTEAARAAPDFKAAMRACLTLVAEHVAADGAFAFSLAPNAKLCELEAEYCVHGAADLQAFIDRARRFPVRGDNSLAGETIDTQRLTVIPDLTTLDAQHFPLVAESLQHGVHSLMSVPFENDGHKFGLTFLYREAPADLCRRAETVNGLSGKVRDLLARKNAEERIALLQSVVLHANDAVIIAESAPRAEEMPRIVFVNRAFSALTGYAPEAVIGRTPQILHGPDTSPAAQERLRLALTRWEPVRIEMVNYRADGSQFWAETDVSPVADANGWHTHWIAILRDTTERKRAEDALRREKDFSEFLIKSTSEGILAFGRDLKVTLWNPGIEAITGLDAARVLGRPVLEVLPYLLGTPGEAALRDALAGRETTLFDQRYELEESGREGYYEAYVSPLYARARRVIGGIAFLRETTERRRIEDALRQSQKMEAVGQLTGGIAHDFNNTLTVITGNLELLEGKIGDEPRLLRNIKAAALAASRAEKLTQQLLTFSRRQQLRPQPIDLNQIIIGMDDLLHRTVGERIEIKTQLAPDLWAALSDPNQIETALLNLVLNARDAMPDGGLITIETANAVVGLRHAELAAGNYATLTIADAGEGMTEDVLSHVFEPFFTTKEVGKGTGLGLAQVYGFIKQSAGHIKIDSAPGKGTTVRIYLPRAAATIATAEPTPKRELPYRGDETVLVVEDDDGVRDFAVSVLRELGYRVIEAPNGDAAMATLAAQGAQVALLFTDVVMPGALNGAELASAARARWPHLRILFTSGYTTRLLEKDWPVREVELLRKPYRSIDLAARVRAVLDHTESARR